MKKIILTVLAGIAVITAADAQKVKSPLLPVEVKSAWISRYPTIESADWEKAKTNYAARWVSKSGKNRSVLFTPEGKFIEQVNAIPVCALPPAVIVYVKEHYKGFKIDEAGIITDAKDALMFEAVVNSQNLVFDDKGNFVKRN